MVTFDCIFSFALIFMMLFVGVTSMRVMYNATKGDKAPLGIRVSQWITFIGLVLSVVLLINI